MMILPGRRQNHPFWLHSHLLPLEVGFEPLAVCVTFSPQAGPGDRPVTNALKDLHRLVVGHQAPQPDHVLRHPWAADILRQA